MHVSHPRLNRTCEYFCRNLDERYRSNHAIIRRWRKSCPVRSFLVLLFTSQSSLACPALSCPNLWCPILSCLHTLSCILYITLLSYHVIPCNVISYKSGYCPALHCPALPCPPCPVLCGHFLSCPVLSCPVLSCPVLSCPVLSCPVLSCHVLSCPMSCPFHSLSFTVTRTWYACLRY